MMKTNDKQALVIGDEAIKMLEQFDMSPPSKRRIFGTIPDYRQRDIWPGMRNTDPKYHSFLIKCRKALIDAFPYAEENGEAVNFVSGSFEKMQTLAGFPQKPVGYMLPDNTHFRADKGLNQEVALTQEHSRILYELIVYLCGRAEFKKPTLPKNSYSGFPDGNMDNDDRIDHCNYALRNANHILELCESRSVDKLFSEHGILFCYAQGFRFMLDTKTRKQNPLEFAMSNGSIGQPLDIPRSIHHFGKDVEENLFRERCRLVWAMHVRINSLISIVRGSLQSGLPEYTFKHRGGDHVCEKLNSYLAAFPEGKIHGADVGGFDNTCFAPRVMKWLSIMHEVGFISAGMLELMRLAYYAAAIQPDEGSGRGPSIVGDLFQNEYVEYKRMLPSGIDLVSLVGKIECTFAIACATHEVLKSEKLITKGLIGNVEAWLNGELPIRLLNAGDDNVTLCPSPAVDDKLYAELKRQGYYEFGVEVPLKFLGTLYVSNGFEYHHYADLHSAAANTFWNEKDFSSRFRTSYAVGAYIKLNHAYATNPHHDEFWRVCNKVMETEMGQSFTTLVQYMINRNPNQFASIHGLSEDEMLVIDKPERMHYLDLNLSNQFLEGVSILSVDEDAAMQVFTDHVNVAAALEAYRSLMNDEELTPERY